MNDKSIQITREALGATIARRATAVGSTEWTIRSRSDVLKNGKNVGAKTRAQNEVNALTSRLDVERQALADAKTALKEFEDAHGDVDDTDHDTSWVERLGGLQ
jgi:hypothetical protein